MIERPVTSPTSDSRTPRHLALGAGVLAARGSVLAARLALAPARVAAPIAGAVWHSRPLDPVRRTVLRETDAVALVGAREEQLIRTRLGAEHVVRIVLERPELERAIAAAAASPETERLLRQVLDSPGARHLLEWVANSDEVRAAIASQTAGLGDMVSREIRGRGASADDVAERLARNILRRRPRHNDDAPR
jgi:hypothetical protein